MVEKFQEIAFGTLYLRLRQEGFHTGVDQQLRMQELLDNLNCAPADLKTVLCPIFASNPTQQAVFYRVFDEVFSLLADAPAPAQQIAAQENNAEPVRQSEWANRIGWLRRARWLLILAVFLGGGLLFWAFHNSSEEDRPIPPKPSTAPNVPVSNPAPVASHLVNLPLPDDVPFTHPDAHWIDFAWSLIFTPLLAYAAFATYRYLRLRASRNRQSNLQEPHFWPLQLEALGSRIFDAADLRETARRMRQRENAMQFTLDVPATITATIRGHGFPNFRYRAIRRPPEYVVFIERVSQADQFAAMTTDLVQMLQAEGVLVFRYYFEGTPRRLFTESGDQIDLLDFAPRTSESRLLLFASSGNLFHPISGKLEAWVQPVFEAYKLKSILLSDAPRRKRVERLQDAGFAVVSADSAGVRQTIDFFESGGVMGGKAFPVFHALDAPPPEEEVLKGAGPDAAGSPLHSWIAACAVYPELNWNLTLRLASPVDPKLACEPEASKVARMPWFRSGEIPASAREQLAAMIPERLRRPIQDSLYGLLSAQLIPKDTFAWENWQNTLRAFRPPAQSWRDRLRTVFSDGPDPLAAESAHDFTFIRFLDRHPKIEKFFKIPERLRALVFEQGMTAFGIRTLAWLPAAVLAALVIAAVLRPWQTDAEDLRQVTGTVVDDKNHPFPEAQINGLSPKPDGRFDLVLTGKLLPVTTPDPYVAQSVASVGGGSVKVVVGMNPSSSGRPKIVEVLYNETANGDVFFRIAFTGAPSSARVDCENATLSYSIVDPQPGWVLMPPLRIDPKVDHDCAARIYGPSGTADIKAARVAALGGPPQILAFSVTPAQVASGDPVRVDWKVLNADSITFPGLKLNRTAVQSSKDGGAFTISPVGPPKTVVPLQIEAMNGAGKVHKDAQVMIDSSAAKPHIVSFTAEPQRVQEGGDVTLRWTVEGSPTLELTRVNSRLLPVRNPPNPTIVKGLQSTTTFHLEIVDPLNSESKALIVLVDPAPPSGDKSQPGTPSVTVQFRNATSSPVEMYWVDFTGKEKGYGAIAAGNSIEQVTGVNHVWRFRQGGQVIASYTASNAPGQQFVIQPPPGACAAGYVWREASPADHVCVTPAVRDQTAFDNSQAAERRAGSGDYGVDTCKPGYVWREAFADDHVCVDVAVRDQAANDNRLGPGRLAGLKKAAY